jgi:hypothetical protein
MVLWFFEFIGTSVLGIRVWRENPDQIFMGHRGFDFRELIKFIKSKGWRVKILDYVPLPVKCWYGNSQVFFMAEKNNR